MESNEKFNKMVEEIKAKFLQAPDSAKDRQTLAAEIGVAVAEAMALQEAERAAANDPERIRQESWSRFYRQTPKPQEPELTPSQKSKIAMAAWKDGERWESSSFYPSMDYEAMMRSREGK